MYKIVNHSQASKIAFLLILGFLFFTLVIWFLTTNYFPISGDFRINLWGPSYQLVHHNSPYEYLDNPDGLNPLWLPMIVGVFFPLGLLPLQTASNLWFILSLSALLGTVAILSKPGQISSIAILIASVLLVIFPSSTAHFTLGQVSLFVVLALVLITKFRSHLPPIVIGGLLAFSCTKPQLIVLFIPAFFSIYVQEKGWKMLLKVIIFTLFWIMVFCLPLFIIYPKWLPDFLQNIRTNPPWEYPTLYGFIRPLFQSKPWAIVIAGLLVLVGIGFTLVLTLKINAFESLLWSLALTTVVSPFIWSWDFVLLYPLLIYTVMSTPRYIKFRITTFGYLLCLLLYILFKIYWYTHEKYTIWVPLMLIVVLSISYLADRQKQQIKIDH